jgi:hypothetical protein
MTSARLRRALILLDVKEFQLRTGNEVTKKSSSTLALALAIVTGPAADLVTMQALPHVAFCRCMSPISRDPLRHLSWSSYPCGEKTS